MLPKILFKLKSPYVFLTFDDGPHPEITPQISDLLVSFDIKATFFVEGRKAQQFPQVVKAVSDAGHVIGNHSFNHPRMFFRSQLFLYSEIKNTDAAIADITDKKPILFRPPYGCFAAGVLTVLKTTNHKMVLWNRNVRDYQKHASPEIIKARIMKSAKPGNIVLLHDGHYNSGATLQALKDSLGELTGSGFIFSAIPE